MRIKSQKIFFGLFLWSLLTACSSDIKQKSPVASWWLTTGNKLTLLETQPEIVFKKDNAIGVVIPVDTSQQFQPIDGFGFALTGGSAMLIKTKIKTDQRAELLKELFLTEGQGIGISYLRVSIGASDLDERVFSYDDLSKGETDPTLRKFNLSYDTLYLIPVLKEILALRPDLKIMAAPGRPRNG